VKGRYDRDSDLQDLNEAEGHDREISLGTSTILGIFFLLALLCAAFFGFGYSMGRRSAQSLVSAPAADTTSDTTSSKPAPGSAAGFAADSATVSKDAADADEGTTRHADSPAPAVISRSNPGRPQTARADTSAVNPVIKPVSMPKPAATPVAPSVPVAVPGLGTFVVQVAAVSHQEDADVLMNALKRRGYSVAIRQTPQDKFLHVQIGPFSNKKDADAMRQRLLSDGYNAIVK
jgi:DedD protein